MAAGPSRPAIERLGCRSTRCPPTRRSIDSLAVGAAWPSSLRLLRDRAPGGRLAPDRSRRGLGIELKRGDAEAYLVFRDEGE